MCKLYRGPSTDVSYQVSLHLGQGVFLNEIFSSETAFPNEPKLGRKHLWKALY
jgi:hypothetical protein